MIALLGMFIVPTSIMRSLALGAILVGIVSVAAALTLLPALLSIVGDRVNSMRVPYLGRNLGRADTAEGRFWKRIVDAVLRRPALSLVLSVGAMLAPRGADLRAAHRGERRQHAAVEPALEAGLRPAPACVPRPEP